MVVSVGAAARHERDPRVRLMDGRRDGPRVADLLELAFRDEPFDDGGRRLLHMLRHYGPFESAMMQGAVSYLWDDGGVLLGNVSLQQSMTRKDTWLIGNVATHPHSRNQGIGTALMRAAIEHARARGGRHVALQVVEGNETAVRLYRALGFARLGAVTHYTRRSVNASPVPQQSGAPDAVRVRDAHRRDHDFIARAAARTVPDDLTYAEPFDPSLYRPGLRWMIANAFAGNRERWHIAEREGLPMGAARSRVNFELTEHHFELLLGAGADVNDAVALVAAALARFERYVDKPIYAAQPRPQDTAHAALQAMGFAPTRTLAHMRLTIQPAV